MRQSVSSTVQRLEVSASACPETGLRSASDGLEVHLGMLERLGANFGRLAGGARLFCLVFPFEVLDMMNTKRM
jgi:hypothetical protein